MILCRLLKSPRSFLAVAGLFFASSLLHAEDGRWQVHGTVTQGMVYSTDNYFYGNSDDDVSFKFTEVNLNGSARLLPHLRLAGQVLYRHAGAATEGTNLDYAFLDYQLLTRESFVAGARAGRFKIPLGLYNETRDVAFTRASIYVPQSLYPDIARDLALSADGALLYATLFSNSGQWDFEIGEGRPRFDKKSVRALVGFLPGDISRVTNDPSYAGRILYQSSDGAWQASLSKIKTSTDYRFASPLTVTVPVSLNLEYVLASLQYSWEQWTFTGEYGEMKAKLDSSLITQSFYPQAYYLQALRRLNSQWSVYGRWDNLYWDRRDRSGKTYHEMTFGYRPEYANFAHDYLLGVRYDIRENMMVSAEFHTIDGTAWLSIADNPDLNDAAKHWNMMAVEFSYRF